TDSFMGKDFYEKGFSHLDHKSKEILNEINKDLVEVESEYNSFMNNISNISKGESEKDLFEKKIKKIMNEKKFFENLRLFSILVYSVMKIDSNKIDKKKISGVK